MADPAASGPDDNSAVEAAGEDDFSSHFAEFASGTPDPNEGGGDGKNEPEPAGGDEGEQPGEASPPAEAPGDKPAAGDPNPDPWANAPAELIAARDAERERYERQVAGASGRARGLQRQLDELQRKPAAQPPEKQKDGGAEGEKSPEDMSDEEWKAFAEDYPEIAKFIAPLRAQMSKVEATVVPIADARAAEVEREALSALEKAHSDFRHYGDPTIPEYAAYLKAQPQAVQEANAAFNGWLGDQRPAIQALYASDDPDDASTVLRLFKSERDAAMKQGEGEQPKPTDTTGAKRARQLEGGRHVGSKPGSAATGAPEDDFDGAFNHFAARKAARR